MLILALRRAPVAETSTDDTFTLTEYVNLQYEKLKQYRFYSVYDPMPRFLLARSLSDAIYSAAELCGGTDKLKNIILDDYEW